MTAPGCERIALADLTDYAAGELPETEAAAIEEHLFSCADCGARAAELDALVRAIPPAVRSAEVGGFVTDAVLNRLAREGVRVRTYALSPGAVVPCAVWDDDELMALRLRGRLWRRQRVHAVTARCRHRGDPRDGPGRRQLARRDHLHPAGRLGPSAAGRGGRGRPHRARGR